MNESTLGRVFGEFGAERGEPLAACLVRDGSISDVYSQGLAGHPGDPLDVVFPIASLSKSFAAAAILALRDEGKLSLAAPVSSFLPELHDRMRWENATVLQLLSMQCGLATDNPWADRFLYHDDEAMDGILRQPFVFAAAPGKEYHYSNLGYMLLGRIITRVSGAHALEFITKRLLSPLGMSSTGWPGIRSDTAVFGGLSSTLRDMSRWVNFLIDAENADATETDAILVRESRRELQRAVIVIPGDYFTSQPIVRAAYAFGTARYALHSTWSAGHSGGLPGSGCHMRWSGEYRCGVIAWGLSTYCPVAGPCGNVLEDAARGRMNYPTPGKLVSERAEALRKLIERWSDAEAEELFASNFFLDMPREKAEAKLATVRHAVKGDVRLLEVVGDRGVGAFFSHNGTLLLAFTLAPAEEGRIQELR